MMVTLNRCYKQTLTGKVRPRRTWYGKVILQVEVLYTEFKPWDGNPTGLKYTEYRDAVPNDALAWEYKSE